MMTDEKIEECVHMLCEENGDAAIISTPWEELDREAVCRALEHGVEIEEIFESNRGHECGCGHHHHHEHGEECGCSHDHEDECGHHHHHHGHGEECGCGHHHAQEDDGHCCGHGHHGHHHHHADEIFTSWGKETAHKYTDEELDFLLKALSETEGYGTVLRSKGIIPMADGTWKQFDLVPEEYEVREGKADYTGRICVIGTDLKEEELLKLFHI